MLATLRWKGKERSRTSKKKRRLLWKELDNLIIHQIGGQKSLKKRRGLRSAKKATDEFLNLFARKKVTREKKARSPTKGEEQKKRRNQQGKNTYLGSLKGRKKERTLEPKFKGGKRGESEEKGGGGKGPNSPQRRRRRLWGKTTNTRNFF